MSDSPQQMRQRLFALESDIDQLIARLRDHRDCMELTDQCKLLRRVFEDWEDQAKGAFDDGGMNWQVQKLAALGYFVLAQSERELELMEAEADGGGA
jgi:hypothetical protein